MKTKPEKWRDLFIKIKLKGKKGVTKNVRVK